MSLLSESDLNDYISPALACTKPTQIERSPTSHINSHGEYEVGIDDGTDSSLSKVTITLSDCLACSGCVTSSEEIMLQQQSHGVFLEAMAKRNGTVTDAEQSLAVSISPECRLSMAQHYGMSVPEFDLCLANLFHTRFNAQYVVGTQLGQNVCVQQTVAKLGKSRGGTATATATTTTTTPTPWLSATDPGFVIYTEKTKPDLVPLLLNVKSAQQVTGALLHASHGEDTPLYHLAIMPSFDQKLEAARPDTAGEVDCVITPKEVVAMLAELGESFDNYAEAPPTLLQQLSPPGWDPRVHWSCSTRGTAYQYIRAQHRALPDPNTARIITLPGKNSNVVEHRLVDSASGKRLAAAAELSGFRNIQNMVRHLQKGTLAAQGRFPKRRVQSLRKRGSESAKSQGDSGTAAPYECDYIEVSAAPGGALNGSGLLTPGDSTVQRRQATAELGRAFQEAFPQCDPLAAVAAPLSPAQNTLYEYAFTPVERRSDIVSVGNTW